MDWLKGLQIVFEQLVHLIPCYKTPSYCYFQASRVDNLYSKITLLLKDKQVASQKRKCYKTKTMLDFSKDHNFKLQGEALDDYQVKIEIKSTTPPLHKSKQSQILPTSIHTYFQTLYWQT